MTVAQEAALLSPEASPRQPVTCKMHTFHRRAPSTANGQARAPSSKLADRIKMFDVVAQQPEGSIEMDRSLSFGSADSVRLQRSLETKGVMPLSERIAKLTETVGPVEVAIGKNVGSFQKKVLEKSDLAVISDDKDAQPKVPDASLPTHTTNVPVIEGVPVANIENVQDDHMELISQPDAPDAEPQEDNSSSDESSTFDTDDQEDRLAHQSNGSISSMTSHQTDSTQDHKTTISEMKTIPLVDDGRPSRAMGELLTIEEDPVAQTTKETPPMPPKPSQPKISAAAAERRRQKKRHYRRKKALAKAAAAAAAAAGASAQESHSTTILAK